MAHDKSPQRCMKPKGTTKKNTAAWIEINEDIKRGGNPAAMQHYHNEPLMLKISPGSPENR